jgi:hypothetical protein
MFSQKFLSVPAVHPHACGEIAKFSTPAPILIGTPLRVWGKRGDKQKHYAKKFGVGVWQRGMVIHILTNETYTGTWHFGKTRMVDDGQHRELKSKRGLGKQGSRVKEEWIPIQVLLIIDPETFASAQKNKAYKKRCSAGIPKINTY